MVSEEEGEAITPCVMGRCSSQKQYIQCAFVAKTLIGVVWLQNWLFQIFFKNRAWYLTYYHPFGYKDALTGLESYLNARIMNSLTFFR